MRHNPTAQIRLKTTGQQKCAVIKTAFDPFFLALHELACSAFVVRKSKQDKKHLIFLHSIRIAQQRELVCFTLYRGYSGVQLECLLVPIADKNVVVVWLLNGETRLSTVSWLSAGARGAATQVAQASALRLHPPLSRLRLYRRTPARSRECLPGLLREPVGVVIEPAGQPPVRCQRPLAVLG